MRGVIEDSRQKAGKHERKHAYWESRSVFYERHELPVGDYALWPRVAVDTKASIVEIAGNLRTDHVRFRNECIRAKENGCLLIVLVENNQGITCLADLERWTESTKSFCKRHGKHRYIGRTLARQMRTMTERYGVLWAFCRPDEAGAKVLELLEKGEAWQEQKETSTGA